jgi:ADP-heptose:LPS heptosyltransferase
MSTRSKTLFASVNLIGDTLSQCPALRRYRASHPDEEIHWLIQGDASRSFWELMSDTPVCDHVLFDSNWDRIRKMDYPGFHKRFLMDVDRAFALGAAAHIHIAQAYGRMVGIDVPDDDILPTVPLRKEDLLCLGIPPRCLVISPQSASNHPVSGFAGNKNLPWEAWPQLIDRFVEAGRVDNYVVLLRDSDPAPTVPLCVLRFPLVVAVAYIAKACAEAGAYCGVDNGITHLAAGLRVPTFCIYPQSLADAWVGYSKFPHYRIAKTNPWEGKIAQIWDCWRHRL